MFRVIGTQIGQQRFFQALDKEKNSSGFARMRQLAGDSSIKKVAACFDFVCPGDGINVIFETGSRNTDLTGIQTHVIIFTEADKELIQAVLTGAGREIPFIIFKEGMAASACIHAFQNKQFSTLADCPDKPSSSVDDTSPRGVDHRGFFSMFKQVLLGRHQTDEESSADLNHLNLSK